MPGRASLSGLMGLRDPGRDFGQQGSAAAFVGPAFRGLGADALARTLCRRRWTGDELAIASSGLSGLDAGLSDLPVGGARGCQSLLCPRRDLSRWTGVFGIDVGLSMAGFERAGM